MPDPQAAPCPICHSHDWRSGATDPSSGLWVCGVCGWPLGHPASLTVSGSLDDDRVAWGRQIWRQLQMSQNNAEQVAAQLDYLTHSMAWLVDRVGAIAQPWIEPISGPNQELPLYSELGLDYAPLAIALSQADWRCADDLTDRQIREAMRLNRPASHDRPAIPFADPNFDAETILHDIARFPETDLRTIAWVWSAYSEGRFGLVAQASQWTGAYDTFCDRVGWRTPRGWLYYDELRFEPVTLDQVPIGHFPALSWRKRACYGVGGQMAARVMAAWLERWSAIGDPPETAA